MPASMKDKAVAAFAEGRVRVYRATEHGIALDVEASKPTADLVTPIYRTLLYDRIGEIVRTCTCPALKNCYHLTAAEMLWRPEGTK
jgi:hypothetical protein